MIQYYVRKYYVCRATLEVLESYDDNIIGTYDAILVRLDTMVQVCIKFPLADIVEVLDIRVVGPAMISPIT
jgi:hypothetical protein